MFKARFRPLRTLSTPKITLRCFQKRIPSYLDGSVILSRALCKVAVLRLSVIKQHSVLFITWSPHGCGSSESSYSIPPIPLSEIRAITRHTPTLGWHYIIIVLMSGYTLPPLYFNNGVYFAQGTEGLNLSRWCPELDCNVEAACESCQGHQ